MHLALILRKGCGALTHLFGTLQRQCLQAEVTASMPRASSSALLCFSDKSLSGSDCCWCHKPICLLTWQQVCPQNANILQLNVALTQTLPQSLPTFWTCCRICTSKQLRKTWGSNEWTKFPPGPHRTCLPLWLVPACYWVACRWKDRWEKEKPIAYFCLWRLCWQWKNA